jgi:hypothetical protein
MTAVDVQGQKKNKFAAKVTKKVSTRTTCFYIEKKIRNSPKTPSPLQGIENPQIITIWVCVCFS